MHGGFKQLDVRFRKRGTIELGRKRIPYNPRSEAQLNVRRAYGKCVQEWNLMSDAEKAQYEAEARALGLTGWQYYVKTRLPELLAPAFLYEVTVTEQAGVDLTDYQVLLSIEGDAAFFEDFQNDHKYLEVYDSDKATLLPFWVEEWNVDAKRAKIWIKIPSLAASSTKKLYLKANASRTEPLSNGEATFILFDHFEGTSLDSSKWRVGNPDAVSVSDSILTIGPGASDLNMYVAQNSDNYPAVGPGHAMRIRLKFGKLDVYSYAGFWDIANPSKDYTALVMVHAYYSYIVGDPNGNMSYSDVGLPADWAIYDICWRSGEAKFYCDGELKATLTSYVPSVNLGAYARPYTSDASNYIYIDYLFIRKYVSPEPTVSYSKLQS